jgi:hypothetical protein
MADGGQGKDGVMTEKKRTIWSVLREAQVQGCPDNLIFIPRDSHGNTAAGPNIGMKYDDSTRELQVWVESYSYSGDTVSRSLHSYSMQV